MRADRTWITKTLMLSLCLAVVALLGSAPASVADGHLATTSSLEGSSCSHPYHYVKDLRKWYSPPSVGATTPNYTSTIPRTHVGPERTTSNNVVVLLQLGFNAFNTEVASQAHPLPVTGVEFNVQWFTGPARAGRICKVRIAFHGLPLYVSHKSHGGHDFVFHHFHTDRPLRLEVTSAR
jgi:hypothetical protein